MAQSGVTVDDAVVESFNQIKLKKTQQYVLYGLSDDHKRIEFKESVPKSDFEGVSEKDKWNKFLEQLPPKECLWAVYDLAYDLGDSGMRNKLCFIPWCPDTAPIKKKMVSASSKDTLKKKLVGIAKEFQGTDLDDLCYDDILEKAKKN